MRRSLLKMVLMLVAGWTCVTLGPARSAWADAPQDDHAGAAHADGAHADHAHEPPSVVPTAKQAIAPAITALIVFSVVLLVLGTKVWPKINNGLAEREAKIRNEIDAAEMAQRQAREALQEYERNLADARAEAQRMLDDAKSKQLALAAELKVKAEGELNAMRDRARRDIEAAKKAAITEVYEESVRLASLAAGKILQREIRPEDQKRLLEESLSELQGVSRA